MKKRYFIFIILIMVFIDSVNAMTLKPTGTSISKRGEEITLYVTLNRTSSEKTVSAVDGILSYDENALNLLSSTNLMSDWTKLSGISNGKFFSYGNLSFDNLITTNNQEIVKMIFKVNNTAPYGNTIVSISNPSATDDEGNSVLVSGGSHNVKILSNVNTLSDITISNGTINFNEEQTEYNLTIDSDSTSINATKKDSSSTISGDIGKKTLKYGLNKFKITVTSETGKTKVYTINITRPDNRSTINTLSSLKLSSGKIDFNKDTTSYNVSVKNNVSSIKIDASLTDAKSSFISGYGPRTVDLKVGNNKIEIKVQAENEKIKIYTINITRKDIDKPTDDKKDNEETKKSNNNYLSELKLSAGSLMFDKKKMEYKVTVTYDVSKIDVITKAEDKNAKIKVTGNESLKVGENIILIKVQAEDESIREYKILVERKEENIVLSNNSKLKSLEIIDYKIDFDSNLYNYNIKINNEKDLNIIYTLDDVKSNAVISGNDNLKNGSVIKITVVAEDGSSTVYNINIEKQDYKNIIIISSIATLLITLGLIIVLLIKRRRKQNEFIL